jgi:hypothetical protein
MTYYVLMEINYQDNEGILSTDRSGHPIKVFTSKKKAYSEALQKNLSEFEELVRESRIRHYGSSLDELIKSNTLEDELLFEEGIFMTIFGLTADEWWDSLGKLKWSDKLALKIEPSDAEWEKLYDCFNLRFWDVVEVKKG